MHETYEILHKHKRLIVNNREKYYVYISLHVQIGYGMTKEQCTLSA